MHLQRLKIIIFFPRGRPFPLDLIPSPLPWQKDSCAYGSIFTCVNIVCTENCRSFLTVQCQEADGVCLGLLYLVHDRAMQAEVFSYFKEIGKE